MSNNLLASGHAWELARDDNGKMILTLKSIYGTIRIAAYAGEVAIALRDVHRTYDELEAQGSLKDAFLHQALEEIDGFDGVLEAQQFYTFIVNRDGSCPFSLEALQAWLSEA